MEEERRSFDILWGESFGRSLDGSDEGEVYVEGQLNLLDEPEFASVERMRALLRTFKEKQALVALLDRCMENEGVQIFVGSEGLGIGILGCGLLLAPYSRSDEPLGSLGVVGPIRMNYARVMALVHYTAQVLSEVRES
jgi:heat-inducible transcriptional repressor